MPPVGVQSTAVFAFRLFMVDRTGNINAAGGFLRALREDERRAGGQSIAQGELPTAEVLLVLLEHGEFPVAKLPGQLEFEPSILHEVLRSLRDLKLITIRSGADGDVALLTDTGGLVARRQRDG